MKRHNSGGQRRKAVAFILFGCGVYWLLGLLGNVLRVSPSQSHNSTAITSLTTGFILVSAAVVLLSLGMRRLEFEQWGITLGRRWWLSSGIIVLSVVLVSLNTDISLFASSPFLYLRVLGASVEELFFRGLLILTIADALRGTRLGWALAIVASAVLFSTAHIPTKSLIDLQGIFISSLLIGIVVMATRSVIFPVFYHVLSNTAGESGLLGCGIAILIFLLLVLVGRYWDAPKIFESS